MLDTVLSTLHMLTNLILIETLLGSTIIMIPILGILKIEA